MKNKILCLMLAVCCVFSASFIGAGTLENVGVKAEETPEIVQDEEVVAGESSSDTGETTPSDEAEVDGTDEEPEEHVHIVEPVEVLPTCTERGYFYERCAICYRVVTQPDGWIPELGHEYVDGVCIRCEAVEVPPVIDGEETGDGNEAGENQTPENKIPDEEVTALVEAFIQNLKDQYGEDYEIYYNAIIEQWGSIKAYIEAKIADGTITESSDSWAALLAWLDEYSVVWAPILAIIILGIVFLVGRYVYMVIKKLFNKLFAGTNQTASAQLAIIDALEIMLGNSEKTKDQRDKLEKAKEELLKNE